MDAFPGYTYFERTKQVLCAIQIADDNASTSETQKTVFPHPATVPSNRITESVNDSVDGLETGETDDAPQG